MTEVKINVNAIKNETIIKLTRDEISSLGLFNLGIYTFKGELKSRLKGFKTTKKKQNEVWFESEEVRFEVLRIQKKNDEEEWAIRRFLKTTNEYEDFWPVLWGCDFFR